MQNDYVGGWGGKKWQKSDYVICERPLTVPVPLLEGAVPHFWDAVPQIVELFHFLWNCSIKSGTVPLCFGLLGYCPNLLLVEWYSILSVIFFYEDVMWFVIGCFL